MNVTVCTAQMVFKLVVQNPHWIFLKHILYPYTTDDIWLQKVFHQQERRSNGGAPLLRTVLDFLIELNLR